MTGRLEANVIDGGRPFIEGGGAQTYPQPYRLDGVHFYGFLLEADPAALTGVCDRYLNPLARDGVRYQPLIDRVMLGVTDIQKIRVGARDDRAFWVPEVDVAFWVPVVAVHRRAGVEVASRFAWMMTYVVVDDAWAVAAGREVYGFPKALGVIRRNPPRPPGGEGPTPLETLTIDTAAVAAYGPEARARVQRLLEIERLPGAGPAGLSRAWTSVRELTEALVSFGAGTGGARLRLPGLGLLEEVVDYLRHHQYPLVFLKQFRDAADGTRACYQAVIEAPVSITAFRGGGWLDGSYRLRISKLASHPVAEELGLRGVEPPVLAAVATDFDLEMGNGRVIWSG